MSQSSSPPTIALPDTFNAALRFLRKRARLTQEELARAVGYSREQIARLENGSRLPDLAVIAALFVPALLLERERALVEQFLALAGQTRREVRVTITHTQETRVQLVEEVVAAAPPLFSPPAPLWPLLGRRTEVEGLLDLLQSARLVTIVGAPGIGKTRLALELANVAAAQFDDGAAFVSLAEVERPGDIAYAVLAQLDIEPSPQQAPDDAVAAALRLRRALLVMDNCEHLLAGAAVFTDWLARAPGLKILCTSRVPLDLYGEYEWPLSPLAVPDLAGPPDLEAWRQCPAMELLLARARAAEPGFSFSEANLLPLASLCVALDGLPLALELAAVRLRELEPAELVQQLLLLRGHAQLSSTWLQQTRRNITERHRTLQAAIGWSVQLLDPNDRQGFHGLGVFAGGGTVAAALAVAGIDAAGLARLSRANIIRLESDRFHLLETLRAYAHEQLEAEGRLAAARTSHAHHYAAFAQEVFAGVLGDEQAAWMTRARADNDNCVAALRWALAQGDGDMAVTIAGGLWWYWYRRGLFALGREMLTAALQLASSEPAARARALNGLASFCLVDEDYDANLACHEEGLALRRQLDDSEGIATVLHNMGLTAIVMGEYDRAMAWLQESVVVNEGGDQTSAWAHMGLVAQETGDLPQARHWLELAYQGAMAASNAWMQAFVMNYLADVRRDLGELDEAARLAQESLRLFTELEDSYYMPDAQTTLAQIALDQGDYATADALAAAAWRHYETRDDAVFMATILLLQAELALVSGRPDEAGHLFERSRYLRGTISRVVSPRERAQYDRLAQALHVDNMGMPAG